MTSTTVIELLQLFETAGINVWLDGGWGVDALLGAQTRPHKDVDIILQISQVDTLQQALQSKGFALRPGGTACSFVMVNEDGDEVDVHAIAFDEFGNGIYRMANGKDWIYPASGFAGSGSIRGMPVRCLSAEAQVLCHAHGYVPTSKDVEDMEALRSRFGVELPPHLQRSPKSPRPGAAALVVTWFCVAALSFIALIIPVGLVIGILFTLHRQQGWGTQKETFPLLVVTHDNGKPIAHVIMQRDLPSFPSSSEWTFLVKPEEREAVINQVRAKRDESGAKEGSFEAVSVAFQDRNDGQLEVHLLASRYLDSHNESWYIAHTRSVTALARRQHLDIGVGIAAAFAAPLPTAILSAIIASLFIFRRLK